MPPSPGPTDQRISDGKGQMCLVAETHRKHCKVYKKKKKTMYADDELIKSFKAMRDCTLPDDFFVVLTNRYISHETAIPRVIAC